MREHRQILERVRNAIQAGQSRFASVPKAKGQPDFGDDPGGGGSSNREGEARSLETLGYLHDIEPGKPCYLFHDNGWALTLTGFDPKEAALVLQERGFLVPGDGGRLKRRQRVGEQSPRFYTVCATILEWEPSDMGKSGKDPTPDDPLAGPLEWPGDDDPN